MYFFNRFIVLLAALLTSVVVTAQSDSLVTNPEFEREIRESQQLVIEKTYADKSVLDNLFKPIDEQLSAFEQTQQRAADLQNAEYVMIVVLLFFLLTLIYVLTENVRHIERGKALENQKSKQDTILAKMLPQQSIREYVETGEIAPVIWGDSLVVIVELLLPNPLPSGMDRRQIKEAISKENLELLATNGLVKIKVSGDRMLSVCKSHKLIPVQQFDRAMSYVSSLEKVLNKLFHGASIRTGVSFGDVVFGAVGASSIRVDLLGLAIDEAAKCAAQGAPGEVWVADQVRSFLGQSENYKTQERLSVPEPECFMTKITVV